VRRFHKELAERVRAALATAPAAREPDDPVALAILHSRRAYDRITEVITADRALLASDAACATMEPADYDRALYDRVGRLTAEQLTDGVRLLVRLASPH